VSDLSLPDDGTSVSLLVRPEQLILDTGTRSGDTSSASDGSRAGSDSSVGAGASATVNSVNYTGHDAVLGLLLDDGTVCESRVTAAGLLTVGTRVTVRIAGSCLAYPA
jgi:iron(III) transport system ATP-binding protein